MSLLKITEFMDSVRDQLLASTDLVTFCNTNYGKDATIFTGWNQKNPPGETNCPFITIVPNDSNVGETQSRHSHTMTIVCAIEDDTFSDFNTNDAIEMKGIYSLDSMIAIVVEEIRKLSGFQNWIADDININFDSITMFPIHVGTITITTTYDSIIGFDTGL